MATATTAVAGARTDDRQVARPRFTPENAILAKIVRIAVRLHFVAARRFRFVPTTVGRNWRMTPFLRPAGSRPQLNRLSWWLIPGSQPGDPIRLWRQICPGRDMLVTLDISEDQTASPPHESAL